MVQLFDYSFYIFEAQSQTPLFVLAYCVADK